MCAAHGKGADMAHVDDVAGIRTGDIIDRIELNTLGRAKAQSA